MKRLLLLALLASGCTSYRVAHVATPPVHALDVPPKGLAQICVFRDTVIGSALTTPIRDNGEIVGATMGRGHFCYHATPGRHTLTTEVSDADPFVVIAENGRHYFIEHEINIGTDALLGIDTTRARRLASTTDYTILEEGPEGEPLPALVPTVAGHDPTLH